MVSLTLMLQGFLIGFALAAPVGPMGILCINKTLARGFASGLLTGVGIALADAVYGLAAAFGLTSVSDFLVLHRAAIGLGGGLFLTVLGLKSIFGAALAVQDKGLGKQGLLASLVSGFFLSLTNPMTILAYVAIFASLTFSPTQEGGVPMACLLTAAIFAGSMIWWLFLSGGIALTRSRLGQSHLLWINRISGVILTGVGLFAMAQIWV
jgi:threonine/homoserine/homoserine lactone efflux protein